ncbi:MAG: BolA family transcriptional regulator [Zetaproteobacteria bacterium CG_4_9_14_3_um_filter_49_83]|nr:MAG: BolA family transcriptional regulator [Zetaproteobacteria bacterium CG1_02_49_23]PIQ29894.1 MAG: BolA family transcriptional regulator [Zetaproteobacteria bacterium CG17_big_fil_post_rev_8_21_14_2_50_50_13]PIV31023.1 MAG: BolA family transcriptional regulator [Zetaproteobacteria bacterium CG02_land_8_20_14_3_00_50_9]PIY55206.1 MAG: BolA family transcriptional regulator [Zetaproteobacteria bacterium CG_4_10_14_0_8_um_filter_49_80]PJA36230.1 MAG: BolA family transcriptional regulator [Zet
MNDTLQELETLLNKAFEPSFLRVTDESWKHAGHEGAKSGGGHFVVEITAEKLTGLSRIAAHRKINEAVRSLFPARIHALSIRIYHI